MRHVVPGRAATAILTTLVAMLTLAGLVNAAERKVISHLGYLWHGDPWHEYMDARIADFEKLHPEVKIDRVLSDRMEEKFTVMVAGGIAPDVVEMTLGQGGGMAPKGAFMDLRRFFAKDTSLKITDFNPTAVKALTWVDGAQWGLPIDIYPAPAWCNMSLFEQAGLATARELGASGWTWEYAMEAFKKLTRSTSGDGAPTQWGIADAWVLISYNIGVKQAGGGLFDRDVDPTKAMVAEPATIVGFEWVREIYSQQVNGRDYENTFQQGLAGMLFTGPTAIGVLNQLGTFKWDVMPPLRGPSNDGGYIAVNSLQMSSYASDPDLAWTWIKFVTADRRNLEDFVRRTTRVPALNAMLPVYPKLIDRPPANVGVFSDIAMNPKSYHPPAGPTVKQASDRVFSVFMDDIVRDGKAVRPTMEALSAQLNAIIDGGRIGR